MKDIGTLHSILWSRVDAARDAVELCNAQMISVGSGGTPKAAPGEKGPGVSVGNIWSGHTNAREDSLIGMIDAKERGMIRYWEALEEAVRLEKMIRCLPHDQMRAVLLTLRGLTFQEVSDKMGIPKTSAWRIYQAGSKAVLDKWYAERGKRT